MITRKPVSNRKKSKTNDHSPIHSLFGVNLASDFPFVNRLARGTGDAELTFTTIDSAPEFQIWKKVEPTYISPDSNDEGDSIGYLYQFKDFDLLRFTGIADFYVWPDRIACQLLDPAYDYLVEIFFLGTVMSYWLERRDIPTLHAAAAVVGNQAVAFLSTNGGGKSSLTAALVKRGHPLLTDDILPIERRENRFFGRPGYPQMRLWPDQARFFFKRFSHLEQVHPELSKRRAPIGPDGLGTFCETPQPLTCLYLPERRDAGDLKRKIEIVPVSSRDAIIELVRQSFTNRLVQAAGWHGPRLGMFGLMAQQIPMKKIIYPNGMKHLNRVCDAIENDLDTIGNDTEESARDNSTSSSSSS